MPGQWNRGELSSEQENWNKEIHALTSQSSGWFTQPLSTDVLLCVDTHSFIHSILYPCLLCGITKSPTLMACTFWLQEVSKHLLRTKHKQGISKVWSYSCGTSEEEMVFHLLRRIDLQTPERKGVSPRRASPRREGQHGCSSAKHRLGQWRAFKEERALFV